MLSAVIFDLDGVLADSEPWWNEIDAKLLAEYGVTETASRRRHELGQRVCATLFRSTSTDRILRGHCYWRRSRTRQTRSRHLPVRGEAPWNPC